MDDAGADPRVEGAAVERLEDPVVRALVDVVAAGDEGRSGLREGGLEGEPPLGPGGVEQADLRVRRQADDLLTGSAEAPRPVG